VVAWVTHGTPCRVGLCFSDALAERVIPLMQSLLGAVALECEPAQAGDGTRGPKVRTRADRPVTVPSSAPPVSTRWSPASGPRRAAGRP